MARLVNLLRWREERRRRRVRFWILMFAGLWLAALAQVLAVRVTQAQRVAVQTLRADSDKSVLQALLQRERMLAAEHKRWQTSQQQALRREQTRQWQTTLQTLAEQMPGASWLTAMQWQDDMLGLSGLSISFPALAAMEQTLKRLPGVNAARAGATKQDSQGRWQFSYQLRMGEPHAGAR